MTFIQRCVKELAEYLLNARGRRQLQGELMFFFSGGDLIFFFEGGGGRSWRRIYFNYLKYKYTFDIFNIIFVKKSLLNDLKTWPCIHQLQITSTHATLFIKKKLWVQKRTLLKLGKTFFQKFFLFLRFKFKFYNFIILTFTTTWNV